MNGRPAWGASLTHAAGVPETAAKDIAEYERIAVELATNPDKLADIKARLRAAPQTLPIRLTPMTATCWVPPLSRVKLGIGWSRGVARDAEQ